MLAESESVVGWSLVYRSVADIKKVKPDRRKIEKPETVVCRVARNISFIWRQIVGNIRVRFWLTDLTTLILHCRQISCITTLYLWFLCVCVYYAVDGVVYRSTEILLYLIILELQEKWQEASTVLRGPMGGMSYYYSSFFLQPENILPNLFYLLSH